jgi:hypothetical protein
MTKCKVCGGIEFRNEVIFKDMLGTPSRITIKICTTCGVMYSIKDLDNIIPQTDNYKKT